ncbi:MAG: hypothetical protein Q4C54_00810 [Clostridia bacterium]|nr:hypothetical protein [Clostridia bacterium]
MKSAMPAAKPKAADTGQLFGDIYAFVFSLLLSSALTGFPLIGGTFFLCGSIACSLLDHGDMALLTKGQRLFQRILYGVLLAVDFLLIFFYPYDVSGRHVWTIFAVQLLVFSSDIIVSAIKKRMSAGKPISYGFYVFLESLLAVTGGCIIFFACPDKRILAAAYLVMFALHVGQHLKNLEPAAPFSREVLALRRSEYRQGYAYRLYELASLFVNMAACICVILVYCTISLTSGQIVAAMGVALLCMLLAALSARLYMNRKRAKEELEVTSLVLWALAFWLGGLVLYCNNLLTPAGSVWKTFVGMALCSYGISLTLSCMREVDSLLQLSTALYAAEDPAAFRAAAKQRNQTVWLVGELFALLFLTFSMTVTRSSYLENFACADSLKPLLLIPAGILIAAAFVTLLLFPVNNRYVHKLKRLLRMREEGKTNRALQAQMESVFVAKRRRPVGINILKGLLRPFFRHKVIGREKLVEDEANPLVILCNHSEIYGPLAAVINLPFYVRPWVISDMVVDPETFAEFFRRNNLNDIKWIPEQWKTPIALRLGKISVWGMNQLDSIPVFRNKPAKLIVTLRQTISAMEAGDNILIFPENPDADPEHPGYLTEGVGPLFDGFVMLADAYYRKAKKCCRFVPVFADRHARTITVGEEITYNPQADSDA